MITDRIARNSPDKGKEKGGAAGLGLDTTGVVVLQHPGEDSPVPGDAGFIGSHVCERLLRDGHAV